MNRYVRLIWHKITHLYLAAWKDVAQGKFGRGRRVMKGGLVSMGACCCSATEALAQALEEEEEKNLFWVMQVHSQATTSNRAPFSIRALTRK